MEADQTPSTTHAPLDSTSFEPPETFNIARYFLEDRLAEGRGNRRAILTDGGALTYVEVNELANRFGVLLTRAGVRPEERVLIALPDGPDFVGALFGALKIGAVGVMLNPHLQAEEIAYFYRYTRAAVLFVSSDRAPFFREAAEVATRELDEGGTGNLEGACDGAPLGPEWGPAIREPRETFVVDSAACQERLEAVPSDLSTYPTHRDDAAIWLFSGGTTGRPKAVVQSHASFANTTECYGKGVLGLTESDVTLSVPKLFFGYATGSNLFFPFSVGATAALFPERSAPATLFEKIERFRPSVLINVPTMINQMLAEPGGPDRDLSCLRLATSAGEALPVELHRRWREAYGVDLLDGLGTAEMWHVFLSNRPGDVHPGTLGRVVPGFEVRVRDEEGGDLPDGEVGWLWVRGKSRALCYWQNSADSQSAFRGEWYVSGDMVQRDAHGVFSYCGRGDDMLKVKGKWLSPGEVEDCLLRHPGVREAAVVGVQGADGLTESVAWVITSGDPSPNSLREFVAGALASYKAPAQVHVVDDLPRTHLGKIDRGALRERSVGLPT